MNNCITIEVLNLPIEARNRLGTNTGFLDIGNPEAIRLTKSAETLSDANKLQTEGVLPFSVPSTPNNDAIFLQFITPLTVDNNIQFYDVRVSLAGHPLRHNRLTVTDIPKKAGDEWGLELRRSPDDWLELAQDKLINTIDFGAFDLTKVNLVANWEQSKWKGEVGQVPYIFPLMDYGGWCDRSLPPNDTNTSKYKVVALEDFRPLVSFPYLLKQGFCEIGWTIESSLFDTDYIAGLYIYALNKEYYKAANDMKVAVLQTTDFTGSGGLLALGGILFNTLDYSNLEEIEVLGAAWNAGLKNTLNIEYNYTFEFTAQIQNNGGAMWPHAFHVCEVEDTASALFTGEVLSDDVVVNCEVGLTDVFVSIDVVLKAGQRAAIRMPDINISNCTIKGGARGVAYPNDKSFYTGQTIQIKDALLPQSLMDWFKSFCHLTRSQVVTDYVTKTVYLYPKRRANVFGEVVSGFMQDELSSVDISELVITDSVGIKPVRPTQTRFTEIGYKATTDAYIKSLELVDEPYRRKVLNGNDLKDGITSYLNLLVEPTLDGQALPLATGAALRHPNPVIPRLYDNLEDNRSYNIAPRLFYAYGKVKQANPNALNGVGAYASFFFDNRPNSLNTGLVYEFGFASMSPLWPLEPTPDFLGHTVFSPKEQDLFSMFWLSITNEQRAGFDIEALMMLRMSDYTNTDFRRFYKFDYRGRPITAAMVKIRDAALCSGIPTPVTFFADPVETECCNLPCGCRFITCEYYQDLGTFLTQDTLDSLTITTFTVDGLSVIDTPVSFGILKIINILGRPFVANLVDTLNSIGAPYMTFGYAQRIDTLRGARFFTVKRPLCTPFVIEISNETEVVYRYTELVQEQSWFGSGFSPLGYGANEYTEPENCITTTEY